MKNKSANPMVTLNRPNYFLTYMGRLPVIPRVGEYIVSDDHQFKVNMVVWKFNSNAEEWEVTIHVDEYT